MNKQRLSQLLDGELSEAETETALDELLADPKLQQLWNSMHTMRAAIRDNGVCYSKDIVSNVSTALLEEPTIIAPDNVVSPNQVQARHEQESANVVPFGRKRNRLLAYVAIAASFAALVMVTYQPEQSPTPQFAEQTAEPVSDAVVQEVQSMIVQHGEFTGAAALNGLVAYAKIVNNATPSENP